MDTESGLKESKKSSRQSTEPLTANRVSQLDASTIEIDLVKSSRNSAKIQRRVRVWIRLSNLLDVIPMEGSVKVDCSVRAEWEVTGADREYDYIHPQAVIMEDDWKGWQPHLEIHNKIEGDMNITYYMDNNAITVIQKMTFIGTIATNMDLRTFPFDKAWIAIHVRSTSYDNDTLELEWPKKEDEKDWFTVEGIVGNSTATGLVDWIIGFPVLAKVWDDTRKADSKERLVSTAVVHIPIKRDATFFLYRIFLVLFIIFGMSWFTFFMDPADFNDRININVTLTVSVVALLFVVNGYLPKLPYLTVLDKVLVATFLFMFLTMMENLVVFKIASNHPTAAATVDKVSAVAFPAVYMLMLIGFWIKLVVYNVNNHSTFDGRRQDFFGGRTPVTHPPLKLQ